MSLLLLVFYFFANHHGKRQKKASVKSIIISPKCISNSLKSTKRNTSEGKIKGTAIEMKIIIPTTSGNLLLLLKTLITNGVPRPVDTPEK